MPAPDSALSRRMINTETAVLLLLGLGASAIYSLLSIIRSLNAHVALNEQTTTLNTNQAQQSWLNLVYQLVDIGLALMPVALALYLLAREIRAPARYLGFDVRRPGKDLLIGAAMAALIGIPGLGLYVLARDLGFNTTIAASGLGAYWWSTPVLVLAAIQNAIAEEVVMIGYLYTRWTQAKWKLPAIMITSAVIRGGYHLYQGFGGFAGNFIMGLIQGTVYLRTRRVMPLVITHAILDIVAFVGYSALHNHIGWLN